MAIVFSVLGLACATPPQPQRLPPSAESQASVAMRQPGGPFDLSVVPGSAHDAGYVWDMSHAPLPPAALVPPTSSMH